jgi:hypothetical protein
VPTAPTVSPIEHEGAVTMQNVVQDAPVTARAANCRMDDLGASRIELLPGGTVPSPSSETYQVVIRLDAKGTGELPVFHAAEQHPKMRLGVEYRVVDRDEGDQHLEGLRHEHNRDALAVSDEFLLEYKGPHHLTVCAVLRVPSQDLYGYDIGPQLKYVLMGTDFFDESTVLEPELRLPAARKMLNRYAYRVDYRLSKDTMARIEKLLRLFPMT